MGLLDANVVLPVAGELTFPLAGEANRAPSNHFAGFERPICSRRKTGKGRKNEIKEGREQRKTPPLK